MRGPWRGVAVGATIAVILTGAVSLIITKRKQQPGGARYVDTAVCASCHAAIAASYRNTGMGRSFSQPAEANVAAGVYHHPLSRREYRVFQRGGAYIMRRHQLGPGGEEVNVEEKEIHYVMGSGNHSRSYLHRTAAGKLLELPLAWYAEDGGKWAMSPGYDRRNHDDFRRSVTYECMFCHNAYPALPPGSDDSGTMPVFPANLPAGIDCQRCHGPGGSHVDAVQKGAPVAAIRAAIVNPARLGRERQLEICMQCHLETTSFPLPYSVRRFERGVFSYRPGESLADYALHFDQAGHEDKFEIVSAVYRLRQSACFRGSQMTCTKCHNPHDALRGAQALAAYDKVCHSCHTQTSAHMQLQNCIDCHMPKRRTEDVVHAVMTDHAIPRRKPARGLLDPIAEREQRYRGEVVPYYPANPPEIYAAVAQVKQGSNLSGGIPRLERAIASEKPRRAEFYFELAKAYGAGGQTERAFAAYEDALRIRADYLPAQLEYAAALIQAGDSRRALELLQKAVAGHPDDAVSHHHLGLAYLSLGRIQDAAQEFREAVKRDPDLSEAWNNLGGVLLETGDRAGAESAFRDAIRVQPDFGRAHLNLAGALMADGSAREAEYHFEQATAADPRSAEAWNGLGDALAIQDKVPQAVECYRKALERKSDYPAASLSLGSALASLGQRREARMHLERAARASDPEISQAARALLLRINAP